MEVAQAILCLNAQEMYWLQEVLQLPDVRCKIGDGIFDKLQDGFASLQRRIAKLERLKSEVEAAKSFDKLV